MMRCLAIFTMVLFATCHCALGESARRALVIGNDSYPGNALHNARHDAKAVAQTLRSIGYITTLIVDADQKQMVHAVNEYTAAIEPGDVSLVYYAGHGMQVGGENYLVPVDFVATSHSDPRLSATSLSSVLEALTRHGAMTQIVILDACRNNPFLGERGMGGGWASLGTSAGTFLAFGTSPGSTASDDPSSQHGLFTGVLLKYLGSSHLDVEQMFQKVRLDVIASSSGTQVPWTASSLVGSFHMVPSEDKGGVPVSSMLAGLARRMSGAPRISKMRHLSFPSTSSTHSAAIPDVVEDERSDALPTTLVSPYRFSSIPDERLGSVPELVRGGKLDTALAIAQAVAASTPVAGIFRLLGLILQLSHRNVEALAAYDRALSLNPSDSMALCYKRVLQRSLDFTDATRDLGEAVPCSSLKPHLIN